MRIGLLVVLVGCGEDGGGVSLGGSTPNATVNADEWTGTVALDGSQQIGVGDSVVVRAGTTVVVAAGARLIVLGTLTVEGTKDAPVVFDAPDGWGGLDVKGTVTGTYLQLLGRGGQILVEDGGALDLADSEADLMNPGGSPDCTSINGGTVTLDHVRFHGCHCPIHINRAGTTTITNSVLDEAAVPVMLAQLDAVFTGNDFVGGTSMQDVGGGITADVAGNYWGGDAPDIQTGDPSQFTGTDDWSPDPIPGAGPR
jgi:hypothetical protein